MRAHNDERIFDKPMSWTGEKIRRENFHMRWMIRFHFLLLFPSENSNSRSYWLSQIYNLLTTPFVLFGRLPPAFLRLLPDELELGLLLLLLPLLPPPCPIDITCVGIGGEDAAADIVWMLFKLINGGNSGIMVLPPCQCLKSATLTVYPPPTSEKKKKKLTTGEFESSH